MENQYPNILFRNDKNIFYARIPYIDKITGNKKRKTVYGSSKNEVKSKIDDFLLSQENDFASTNKNKTIAQVIREEAENDYALNNIQESSYLRRIETLKMIEKHCIAKVKIKDIDKNIINSFFRYLVDYGYSNSTIKKYVVFYEEMSLLHITKDLLKIIRLLFTILKILNQEKMTKW